MRVAAFFGINAHRSGFGGLKRRRSKIKKIPHDAKGKESMELLPLSRLPTLPLKAMVMMLSSLSVVPDSSLAGDAVVSYPAPQGEKASEDYKVDVGGKPVFVYTASVLRGGPASFAYFDISRPVTVSVTAARKIGTVKILPTSYGIKPIVADNKVSFTVTKPANLTIEPNGDSERPCICSPTRPKTDPPDPTSKDVIYFGPGVHEVTTIRPKSGQTVYLAGGAILRAKIPPDEKPIQEKNWRGNKVYATLIETSGDQGREDSRARNSGLGSAAVACPDRDVVRRFPGMLVEGIIILDAPAWVVAMHNSKTCRHPQRKADLRPREQRRDRHLQQPGRSRRRLLPAKQRRRSLRENDLASTRDGVEEHRRATFVVWNDRARGLGITSETRANISNVLFKDCDIIHDFSQAAATVRRWPILVSDSGTMS